jgi:two-component system, OmpR family, response regulator AdeR
MDICCPRCGGLAEPAGHEDARAFFQCPACNRVWATHISAVIDRSSTQAIPSPRVLVADDSPEMLGLLAAWLEDEGCMVIAVGSGREALDASIAYRPHVAFIDLVLPPPDGFQLSEMLNRRTNGPAVVLMTGMANADRQRVADAGAVVLLQKPFTREAMIDALTAALERSRRDDQPGPQRVAVG